MYRRLVLNKSKSEEYNKKLKDLYRCCHKTKPFKTYNLLDYQPGAPKPTPGKFLASLDVIEGIFSHTKHTYELWQCDEQEIIYIDYIKPSDRDVKKMVRNALYHGKKIV